jgi:hypothetical protein
LFKKNKVTEIKEKKQGLVYKLGYKYIEKGISSVNNASEGHILSKEQLRQIRKITLQTYAFAAAIGAIAVLVVVIPYHAFNSFFGEQTFVIFEKTIKFELYYTIFAVLMLFPEIWALNFINLRAVKLICAAHHFPVIGSKDYKEQVELLTESGLEMPAKHLEIFKINPYLGLSKIEYYSYFLFNKLKATLSNLVTKILIKRFLGRYALRIVTDLAGIPIFAFWNAYASAQVIKESRMRIMATSATKAFLATISDEDLKKIEPQLNEILHFIAQQKRAYNFALFAYFKAIVERLPELDLQNKDEITLAHLTNELLPETSQIVSKMIAFGLVIDGHISLKEKIAIRNLVNQEWFSYTNERLDQIKDNYVLGRGISF